MVPENGVEHLEHEEVSLDDVALDDDGKGRAVRLPGRKSKGKSEAGYCDGPSG